MNYLMVGIDDFKVAQLKSFVFMPTYTIFPSTLPQTENSHIKSQFIRHLKSTPYME